MSKIEKHIEYWSNGRKKEEGTYKNGEKVGEWIYFNTDGFIERVVQES